MSDTFIQLNVARGSSLARDFQAVDAQGNARTGVYLTTDTFAGVIWPAGGERESAIATTPSLDWIDGATGATAGQWRFQLHQADTDAIGEGSFRVIVTLARGGDKETLLDAYLNITGVGGSFSPPPASTVTDQTGTTLGLVSTLYCTDENIAVKCLGDFAALLSASQTLAFGSDGTFSTDDAWTLTSVSNDFESQGVAVGSVVQLTKPAKAFPAGGLAMAVSAVNGTSLTLRRIGLAAGLGMPPAPSTGLIGVEFSVSTFQPQIEEATYSINQRWDIRPDRPGRRPSDVEDLRVLRRACVLMVLIDRYSDETRTSGDYAKKLESLQGELSAVNAQLEIRWSARPEDPMRTSWFSMRIVR